MNKRAAGGAKIDDDIFDTNLNAAGNKEDFAFDDHGKNDAIDEDDIQDGRMTVMVGNRHQ